MAGNYHTEMDGIGLAVIGTGNVGRTLADGWANAGHRTTLAGRDPGRDDLAQWSSATGVPVASIADAVAAAEVAVLATAWGGTENALSLAGAELAGKVLVDVTNPLVFTDRLRLAIGHDDSGGEQVQRWAPDARVVKAFNTVGFELFVHPELPDGPGTMFIASDDADAKQVATGLAVDLGWQVHDCGGLVAARLTEPLAMIWIEHALRSGRRDHAFRLLGVPAVRT